MNDAAPETEVTEAPAAESVATATEAVTTTTQTEQDQSSTDTPKSNSSNLGLIIGIVVVIVVALSLIARKKKPCTCGCGGSKGSQKKNAAPASCCDGSKPVEIYVGNLSYSMTDDQFRKEFERFGVVKSARIIGHRASGKSKGYGFVEMPHRKEAEIAIKNLNNREVMGRKLRVNEARHGVPKD